MHVGARKNTYVQCVLRIGRFSGYVEIFVAVGHHEPKTDVNI